MIISVFGGLRTVLKAVRKSAYSCLAPGDQNKENKGI
jgi:hypothetical protein